MACVKELITFTMSQVVTVSKLMMNTCVCWRMMKLRNMHICLTSCEYYSVFHLVVYLLQVYLSFPELWAKCMPAAVEGPGLRLTSMNQSAK